MTNTLYISGTVLWLAALYDISNGDLMETTLRAVEMVMIF